MVVSNNGVDRICVNDKTEALELLSRLSNETSLSKKEIVESVSFDLSVADVVRCYNSFIRADERKVVSYEKTFNRAA